MNVYDFDGTVYCGDSSVDFYLFCAKKHFFAVARSFPHFCLSFIQYKRRCLSKKELKEAFFSFVANLADLEELVQQFWNKNRRKIYTWYLVQHSQTDVIVSASPDFLLIPICSQLNVSNLIASIVDPHSGKFMSENCYGQEKVNRFFQIYSNCTIDNFYSDSRSDWPMKEISKNAFLIKKGIPIPWEG